MVLWRIILLQIFAVTIRVHSQLDSNGFLSIDCGLSVNSSYVDPGTKLTYVSDEQFIDTGVISRISSSYIASNSPPKEYETVRSFPTGIRNCYTLKSLRVGFKYLIRATFIYANYDNLNKPPNFDIYLGVNFWDTVKDYPFYPEIIVTATTDYLHVCLVNNNLGNPFISSLHLRQLNSKIYEFANATQSLIWVQRKNLGGSKDFSFLGYPQDKYDRWWWPETLKGTIEISTNSTIQTDPDFETPSVVMQTAATTSSTQKPLNLYWNVDDKYSTYYWIFHFYEIQPSLTGRREFDILFNGDKPFNKPTILQTWYWNTIWWFGFTNYNISLVATSNSTLPPLLNAYELYKIAPVGIPTYSADVAAINSIKQDHQIKKGWSGDPCLPKEFIWTGVSCTSNSSNITRITAIKLSSSGLTGPLSYYIGNLNALVSLDLSSNDLSGSLPSSLDQLTALTYLDIRGNSKISTTLPLGLQKKQQNGSLTYRFGDINPTPSSSSKKNIIIIISIVVVVLLLVIIAVVVATVFCLRRKNKQSMVPAAIDHPKNYANIPEEGNPLGNYAGSAAAISIQPKAAAQGIPNFDNRQFSYNDLKRITNDFKNNIGIGGFGSVYWGHLENGLQVAIKVLSQSSTQGVREFMAEAENLTRVHHRNLVSLMGYCIDKSCMALVYEYMQGGNLHDKLKDNEMPLSWKQRLRIAYESALGLEYLHKACNPPLIHRDVKTSNILLNANLEAKIADFGLSRAFDSDATSHVSTRIVGTLGYLDPEYYLSNQLSAKSDVFSFGVVMLEIITGRPPIINAGREGGNLVQWVRQKLSGGDIESIVDSRMEGKYDINSVWKVTDLACQCTEPTSSQRPTMSTVVAELKESMDFEMSMEEIHRKSTTNLVTDVSLDSTFEMAYMGGMPTIGPSVRDLSSNDLSGALPSSLDQLTALTYLDIRGNSKISTTLPLRLQEKQQNGSLSYRFGDKVLAPSPSPSPSISPSSKKNIIISTAVVVPLLVISVVVTTVFWLRRKCNKSIVPKPNGSFESNPAAAQGFLDIDNRQFSYNDLKRITNDFKNNIGNGGFGSVYLGIIENGFQVAVKMRSNSSTQGVEELVVEAKNLARVHHKNLVTLMGYCIDGNCMALVYEYMQEGNLQQKLKDDVRPLTWKQRLRIAYQSALGMLQSLSPPLFEAKIADFGLCRTFDNDVISYVLTGIIGTPGYVDPEYYLSNQLCAKSDVFSFRVVLLEIITGQPPINAGVEGVNLVRWVRQELSGGDIESIVDPRMQHKYDINSVWKVTNLACKCTEFTSSERSTMAVVAAELKESLDLETSIEEKDIKSTETLLTDESKDRDFEMTSLGGIPTIGPSER